MENNILPATGDGEMKPRSYQVILEEIAVKKNTILHLPTGKRTICIHLAD